MACIGITGSLKRCKNYSCADRHTCSSHSTYTKELHYKRWTKKYLKVDLFNFDWATNIGKELLVDLQNHWMEIDESLIKSLPPLLIYVDIFTFLCKHGYAKKEWNIPLWKACLRTILQRMFIGAEVAAGMNERHWDRNKPIVDTLILSSGTNLLHMLQVLPSILKEQYFQKYFQTNPTIICDWIQSLSDSRAARELSWNRSKNNELVDIYKNALGHTNPLTLFIETKWVIYIMRLYAIEKDAQQWRMNRVREELMAITWHPERLWKWIHMGFNLDNI